MHTPAHSRINSVLPILAYELTTTGDTKVYSYIHRVDNAKFKQSFNSPHVGKISVELHGW
jgi:hypothetical protein